MIDPEETVFIAVLPPGQGKRAEWWENVFGERRVPVTKGEPDLTILPDGEKTLCYFVDFGVAGDVLLNRMIQIGKTATLGPAILGMLAQRIYPIKAEGITVVEAPLRMWRNGNHTEGKPAE